MTGFKVILSVSVLSCVQLLAEMVKGPTHMRMTEVGNRMGEREAAGKTTKPFAPLSIRPLKAEGSS